MEREVSLKLGVQAPDATWARGLIGELRQAEEAAKRTADSVKRIGGPGALQGDVYQIKNETYRMKSHDVYQVRPEVDLQAEARRRAEQDFRRDVEKTVEALNRRKRIQEELVKLGLVPPAFTEAQERQLAVQRHGANLKKQEQFRADLAAAGYGPAKPGVADYGQLMGIPKITGPLAAAAVGISALNKASRALSESFERGQFSFKKFEDNLIQGTAGSIPILGPMVKHTSRSGWKKAAALFSPNASVNYVAAEMDEEGKKTYAQREAELKQSEINMGFAAQRSALFGQANAAARGYQAQGAAFRGGQAGRRYGEAWEAHVASRTIAERGAAQSALFGRNTYDRSTQQADVAALYNYRQEEAGIGIERDRRLIGLQHQEGTLGTQKADVNAQLSAKRAALDSLLRKGGDPDDAGYKTNHSLEEETKQRAKIAGLQSGIIDLTKQQNQLADESLRLAKERADVMNQAHDKTVGLLSRQRDLYAGIAEQEKRTREGRTENVGLMMPHEQMRLLHTARKVSGGGPLSLGDIQYMKQHADIFKPQLQKIGAARGTPIMAELNKLLPHLNAREKHAEAMKAHFETAIKAEYHFHMDKTTREMVAKMEAGFAEAQRRAYEAFAAQMDKMMNLRKRAMDAAMGSAH